jgi:hypothetical protein
MGTASRVPNRVRMELPGLREDAVPPGGARGRGNLPVTLAPAAADPVAVQ